MLRGIQCQREMGHEYGNCSAKETSKKKKHKKTMTSLGWALVLSVSKVIAVEVKAVSSACICCFQDHSESII